MALTDYNDFTEQEAGWHNTPQDLSTVFHSEIDAIDTEENATFERKCWLWMKQRIQAGNFQGLHIGDYLPLTSEYVSRPIQIADIHNGVYKDFRSLSLVSAVYPLYTYIDFISANMTMSYAMSQWNETDINCGNTDRVNDEFQCPYRASTIYSYLNDTFYPKCVSVKDLLTAKYDSMEVRPTAEEPLTSSTSCLLGNYGLIWLPTETSVFGTTILGTPGLPAGNSQQLPLFAFNRDFAALKGVQGDGGPRVWPTATVADNSSTNIVAVSYIKSASSYSVPVPVSVLATTPFGFCFGFRISA